MRAVGRAVVLALIAAGTGCNQVAEEVVGWTGSTFGLGESAVLPPDFPMDPPDGAILVSSLEMELGGYRTTTVKLAFPKDPGDLLPSYVQVMQARGLEVTQAPVGDAVAVIGHGANGERWTAALTRTKSYGTLSLSVMRSTTEPPPAPVDPAPADPAGNP